MVWSNGFTLGERFAEARHVLDESLPHRRRVGRTYQGLIKAMHRLFESSWSGIESHLRSVMTELADRVGPVHGWSAFAVDGTKFQCPRTRANERSFGKAGKRGCAPQMLTTTLWHMGLGLPWAWRIGRARASERTHLRRMLHLLPANALLVMDAGYPGFNLLNTLQRQGKYFLMRVGRNVTLLTDLGYEFEQRCGEVWLWNEQARRAGQPPLRLRLITIKDRKRQMHLLTNVLESARLPRADARSLYQMRWGVETFHRALKQTMERRVMRSAAPKQARMELHATIVGLLLLGLLSVRGLIHRRIDPHRWSPAASLEIVRTWMRKTTGALRTLSARLARAVKDPYQRNAPKARRRWPRKKTESPPGTPRIRTATPLERRSAQALTCEKQTA